jgi:hypothetical protein
VEESISILGLKYVDPLMDKTTKEVEVVRKTGEAVVICRHGNGKIGASFRCYCANSDKAWFERRGKLVRRM